jgi:hypothetical protein
MRKLLFKKNCALERVMMTLLLAFLIIPNLSWSQTDISLPPWIGSFESPQIAGSNTFEYAPSNSPWTFHGQSGLSKNGSGFTWANPNAPLGNQVLFLQNQGYVETGYYFSTGYYRFRFKAAWREGCCEKPKYIRVIVDGVEAGEVELRSKNYEEYWTMPVYLTAGTKTIRLEGANPSQPGDYTGFVDDFSIQRLYALPNYTNWTVPNGSTYVFGSNHYNYNELKVHGTLLAAQNRNVNIDASFILVELSGRLQIGQELSPYTANATITLTGTDLTQHDPMGTKFLGAMGSGVIELHGEEKVSWTKLSSTADDGDTVISVVDPVDWSAGDDIVIAPTVPPGVTLPAGETFWNQYEKRKISSIASNNKDITLTTSLDHKHIGATKNYSHRGNPNSWTLDMRAEVGLLTRNIKIQGNDASLTSKIGAHMMIMGNSKAFIDGVELYRVGQSAQMGRYPFHWHHRHNADGQYFRNSSVHHSFNRALTIHRTNHVEVHNNVFFDHVGHGIFFEEGNEFGNDVVGNLVIGTKRPLDDEVLISSDTIKVIQNKGPASFGLPILTIPFGIT